jgi:hypothetical protein
LRSLAAAVGLMICLAGSPRWVLAETESRAEASPGTAIPFKKDDRDAASGLPTAVAVLALLVLLGWGGLHALRRFKLAPPGLAGKARRVRLIEAVRIDPKVTLYLVAADDRTLLLGRCGDTLVLASELAREARPSVSTEAGA